MLPLTYVTNLTILIDGKCMERHLRSSLAAEYGVQTEYTQAVIGSVHLP